MALTGNQTCELYDQCAAVGISCGGGRCKFNSTGAQQSSMPCECKEPLVLIQVTRTSYDCACPSLTDYFDEGVCKPRPTAGIGNYFVFQKSEISIN